MRDFLDLRVRLCFGGGSFSFSFVFWSWDGMVVVVVVMPLLPSIPVSRAMLFDDDENGAVACISLCEARDSVTGTSITRHGHASPLRSVFARRSTSCVDSAAALNRSLAALLGAAAI